MARLNVYFSHSTKFDYNNTLYKKILSSPICLSQNLILPMTDENKTKYKKHNIHGTNSNSKFAFYKHKLCSKHRKGNGRNSKT